MSPPVDERRPMVARHAPSTAPATTARLAVAITTKDSMRSIERAVESVRGLADRVVVVDSGSTDDTVATCRRLGAEVVHNDWPGHVEQKRYAIEQCAGATWVLLLDSDESVEPSLRASIAAAMQRDDPDVDGYELRRKTWFLDGWLHHAYQPEWRVRLVRPSRARVTGTAAHDRIEVDGATRRLAGVLRHDSWADLTDLATRQISYAQLAADGGYRGGTIFHLLVSPTAAMLKQLILKRGVLDGRRGLIVAGMTFNATMLKHAFLAARRLRDGSDRA